MLSLGDHATVRRADCLVMMSKVAKGERRAPSAGSFRPTACVHECKTLALDYLDQRDGVRETWRWLYPNSNEFEPRVQASGYRFKRITGPDINGTIQFDS